MKVDLHPTVPILPFNVESPIKTGDQRGGRRAISPGIEAATGFSPGLRVTRQRKVLEEQQQN